MTITPWEYVLIFAPQNTTLPRAAGCICDSVLRAFGQSLEAGKFDNEVVPVAVPQRRGEPVMVTKDEEYTNVKLDKIPSLNAAFTKDGTVTAANASTINDGAAALVLMSEEKAQSLG
jgi:acetyl-CoA acetyltransferase